MRVKRQEVLYGSGFAIAVGCVVVLSSSRAHACHTTTACIHWNAGFNDNGFGEDYGLDDTVPASGTRVTIIRPPPEPPISAFLDSNGCISFETEYNYGLKAVVYADAVVGGVHIRPFASPQEQADDVVYEWEVDLHGLAPDPQPVDAPPAAVVTNYDIQLDPAQNAGAFVPIPTMMAAATVALARYATPELDAIPPDPAPLHLVFTPMSSNARCRCNGGGGTQTLDIGPDAWQEKFAVAHELGHYLQTEFSNDDLWPFCYTYPHEVTIVNGIEKCADPDSDELQEPLDTPCAFPLNGLVGTFNADTDANLHGIRSAEWASGAFIEGFAHFMASSAFNDLTDEDGIFRYYKTINADVLTDYEDFVQGGYIVSLRGGTEPEPDTLGGANRWAELMCPDDWSAGDGVAADVGSEIDWMRFWWRFSTDQSTTGPSLREVLSFVAYTRNQHPWAMTHAWAELYTSLKESGSGMSSYQSRFETLTTEQGVRDAI